MTYVGKEYHNYKKDLEDVKDCIKKIKANLKQYRKKSPQKQKKKKVVEEPEIFFEIEEEEVFFEEEFDSSESE